MKHKLFIGLILVEMAVLAVLLLSGQTAIRDRQSQRAAKRLLVNQLMLTDFALWTEARYTRNPSQADLFTPFQDFPSAIEHFPAGSIMAPGKITDTTRLEFKKTDLPVRSR
jgi:Tfp pilus assembly protein PilV